MTPKEKAKQLIDKFEDHNYHFTKEVLENAKYNSSLCVDEILVNVNVYGGETLQEMHRKYWTEVKREIQAF